MPSPRIASALIAVSTEHLAQVCRPAHPARSPRTRVAALVLLAAASAAAAPALLQGGAGWFVQHRVLPEVARRLGAPVECGEVVLRGGYVELSDVAVHRPTAPGAAPLLRLDRVIIDVDVPSVLRGQVAIVSVDIDGGSIELRADAHGDDLAWLLGRVSTATGPGNAEPLPNGSPGRLRAPIAARNLSVSLFDNRLAAPPRAGQPVATASQVEIQRTDRGVAVRSATVILPGGTTLTDVAGTAGRTDRGDLAARVGGAVNGAPEARWALSGQFPVGAGRQPAGWPSGNLRFEAKDLPVAPFAGLLRALRAAPAGLPPEARALDLAAESISADLAIAVGGERLRAVGQLDARTVAAHHPALSAAPVRLAAIGGSIDATLDWRDSTNLAASMTIDAGGVNHEVNATLRWPGAVELRWTVPEVACQTALDSLPLGLVPRLRGFELDGRFASDVHIAVDLNDLERTVFDTAIDIDGCRVQRAPKAVAASRFRRSFGHTTLIDGGRSRFVVGPRNPNFVRVADVSPHLVNALLTTEDSRFFRHRGFSADEFRTALVRNLQAGRFKYGASSITMQVVKNVVLGPKKTLSRKLQELFLVWYFESELRKDRLLEIYLNVIEFGPGLFGIKRASQAYFGKAPADLSPAEAAFFSSIVPAPRRRYVQRCRGRLLRATERKIERVLERMVERERLTAEDSELARQTPLAFAGDAGRLCRRR